MSERNFSVVNWYAEFFSVWLYFPIETLPKLPSCVFLYSSLELLLHPIKLLTIKSQNKIINNKKSKIKTQAFLYFKI
jgi:hypothetical protein